MKWTEDDDFFAALDYEDDDKDPLPELKPSKSKKALDAKAKTLTAHPLHSVIPRDSKAGKAIAWWAAGVYMYKSSKRAAEWLDERMDEKRRDKFTINIESYDEEDLYNFVFGWIISEINEEDEPVTDYSLVTIYRRPKNTVFRTSRTDSSFFMELCGIPVQISLDEKETKDGAVSNLKRGLVIRCKDKASVDLLTNEITRRFDEFMYSKDKAEVDAGRAPRPFASWTGMAWNWREMLPRDLNSVVLRGTDKEVLFEDIDLFRQHKPEYLRTNIPWHRGYLFHGPPGTGKTSLGMAVASQYDLPIYFMSLDTVADDSSLVKAISNIEGKEAVLILEDIDVVDATHSRNDKTPKSKGLTLSGLLNVLDGVNSPSGLITIMTTNHITTLDPALIRPGRVDMQLEVGFLDDDQLRRLVLWYIGVDVDDFPKIESDITPAQITGIVKNTMGNPDECIYQIKMFIEDKNTL